MKPLIWIVAITLAGISPLCCCFDTAEEPENIACCHAPLEPMDAAADDGRGHCGGDEECDCRAEPLELTQSLKTAQDPVAETRRSTRSSSAITVVGHSVYVARPNRAPRAAGPPIGPWSPTLERLCVLRT